MVIKLTLAIISCLMMQDVGTAQECSPEVTRSCRKVSFTLAADKKVYGFGEAIGVLYVLENIGTRAFYLNPAIEPAGSSDSGVRVLLYDHNDRIVPGGVVGHAPIPNYARINLLDYIPEHWILMLPGALYGIHTQYFSSCSPAPGRYKLSATYFSNIGVKLTLTQKNSLTQLPNPILDGTIQSNDVWIQISTMNTKKLAAETCNAEK